MENLFLWINHYFAHFFLVFNFFLFFVSNNKPPITNSNIGAGRRSDILKHAFQRGVTQKTEELVCGGKQILMQVS